MTNWVQRLDVGDVFALYKSGAIDVHQLADAFAKKITDLPMWKVYKGESYPSIFLPYDRELVARIADELEEIVDYFEEVRDVPGWGAEDFDGAMNRLYDWGDQTLATGCNVCWMSVLKIPS